MDGKGFMAEFQPDCVGTYHNFGYAIVIFKTSGTSCSKVTNMVLSYHFVKNLIFILQCTMQSFGEKKNRNIETHGRSRECHCQMMELP